jgi:hypothetical protein
MGLVVFCACLFAIVVGPPPLATWSGLGALALLAVGVIFLANYKPKP